MDKSLIIESDEEWLRSDNDNLLEHVLFLETIVGSDFKDDDFLALKQPTMKDFNRSDLLEGIFVFMCIIGGLSEFERSISIWRKMK